MNSINKEALRDFLFFNNDLERDTRTVFPFYIPPTATTEDRLTLLQDAETLLIHETVRQIAENPAYFQNEQDIESLIQAENTTPLALTLQPLSTHSEERFTLEMLENALKLPSPLHRIEWKGENCLLMGLDFYASAFSLIRKVNPKTEIILQTDGVGLNDAWLALCQYYDVTLAIYFDGLTNDSTRKNTGHLMKWFNRAEAKPVKFSALMRVNSQTRFIPEYNFTKKLRLNTDMRFTSTDSLPWVKDYASFGQFADYWVHDIHNPQANSLLEGVLKSFFTLRERPSYQIDGRQSSVIECTDACDCHALCYGGFANTTSEKDPSQCAFIKFTSRYFFNLLLTIEYRDLAKMNVHFVNLLLHYNYRNLSIIDKAIIELESKINGYKKLENAKR